jgi:hypothetical protein
MLHSTLDIDKIVNALIPSHFSKTPLFMKINRIKMSDDRYSSVPDYMANAFRNIDRHYKQRKTIKGKLEQTDYTNVIDMRHLDLNAEANHDSRRVIEVATRQGGFNGYTEWDWNVEKAFNKDWVFQPSSNIPVTGTGLPPKKPTSAPNENQSSSINPNYNPITQPESNQVVNEINNGDNNDKSHSEQHSDPNLDPNQINNNNINIDSTQANININNTNNNNHNNNNYKKKQNLNHKKNKKDEYTV